MNQFWGKAKPQSGEPSYHPLAYHALDVAAVAAVLLKKVPIWRKTLGVGLSLDPAADNPNLDAVVAFLVSLHDIGKFSFHFQNLVPELCEQLRGEATTPFKSRPIRHDALGQALFNELFSKRLANSPLLGLDPVSVSSSHIKNWLRPLFVAVTGHHGNPPKEFQVRINRTFSADEQTAAWEFVELMGAIHKPNLQPVFDASDANTKSKFISHHLAGFTMLCDWLGSNQDFFPYREPDLSLPDYWAVAKAHAETAVDQVLIVPPKVAAGKQWLDLFPNIKQPTQLQDYAAEVSLGSDVYPSMYIIEDLTGSGKTEAALFLAYRLMAKGRANGLYFALPTMATADQMYDRLAHSYQAFYDHNPNHPASLVLAHGSRHLSKAFQATLGFETPEQERDYGDGTQPASAVCSPWLADKSKKSLLANIGVGTIDQAMLSVLPAKHSMLRLLGLTGKVLILDEIHAYDQRMNSIIKQLISFHTAMGGSTILLSATLPQWVRDRFIDGYRLALKEKPRTRSDELLSYPLFTSVNSEFPDGVSCFQKPPRERQLHINTLSVKQGDAVSAVRDLAARTMAAGRNLCWIRNTVQDALDAWEALANEFGADRVTLFHARFLMGDRLDIQERVLKNFGTHGLSEDRRSKIVISTQVIEQSINVDFDELVTDLAPIDLILQRAGRQRRHPRDESGQLIQGDPAKAWAQDQRLNQITVLTPPFSDTPDADWYGQTFKRANHVYRNTTYLWLTHRELLRFQDNQPLNLPGDVRDLIEVVYNPAEEEIPAGLGANFKEMEAEACNLIAGGNQACLQMSPGYEQPALYDTEENALTRTGLDQSRLRLAGWDGERFFPLVQGEQAWFMSMVSIARSRVAAVPKLSGAQSTALKLQQAEFADKNKHLLFIPMWAEGDFWTGLALDANNQEVRLRYDRTRGLEVG